MAAQAQEFASPKQEQAAQEVASAEAAEPASAELATLVILVKVHGGALDRLADHAHASDSASDSDIADLTEPYNPPSSTFSFSITTFMNPQTLSPCCWFWLMTQSVNTTGTWTGHSVDMTSDGCFSPTSRLLRFLLQLLPVPVMVATTD